VRTLAACLVLLAAGCLAASRLTEGFNAWTAEGARRLAIQREPVLLPAARMIDGLDRDASLPRFWCDGARVWIVDFIYTRCPSLCLAMGTEFQQLQREIRVQGLEGQVGLLSVSFDLAHDDPTALREYTQRMHADPAIWPVVVPRDEASLRSLLSSFGVVVIPVGRQGYQHNEALHVVDAGGTLLRIFDYSEGTAALSYASALRANGS
jgi:protein SCO1/2